MNIQILCVGRLKSSFKYLQTGVEEYVKRLGPIVKVSLVEVADETVSPSVGEEQVLKREGERLLAQMERASYTIVLSEAGERLTSQEFAKALANRVFETNPPNGGIPIRGSGPIIVVIGGALGVSQDVLDRADWVLSLSPMTFPHPLVRLIVLEQLYRALKIHRGEPYHK